MSDRLQLHDLKPAARSKKKAIRPSLTQCRRSREMPSLPMRIESSVLQKDSYESGHGELAQMRAASAAQSSATAPADSVLRKSRTGAAMLRAHAVRSVKGRVRGRGREAICASTAPAPGGC